MSASDLSSDAIPEMTKIKLELIIDPGMYISFEKDTRDGICYICNRYSKASNKCLKSYDPKQISKHYTDLHANNYAMSKFLPT